MTKRLVADQSLGLVIDVQDFFLAQAEKRLRPKLKANLKQLVRLLDYFRIPVIATLERPVERKGRLPKEIKKLLGASGETFEKDSFDLTKEAPIKERLTRIGKKQAIVAGCETDVCVLQSCLGLIELGFEVFLVEELLFSSSRDVRSAIARMKAEGAIFLTYKTLYYELLEAVEGGRQWEKRVQAFGPIPEDLPDTAA